MKEDMKAKIKFGGLGIVIGGIIAMIIGFSLGGWTTSATAHQMSTDAVLASQAAICVAQFVKEPNSQEKLKNFEAVESYNRFEFIEKGGWNKMPGQKEASPNVASACVAGVEALIKK